MTDRATFLALESRAPVEPASLADLLGDPETARTSTESVARQRHMALMRERGWRMDLEDRLRKMGML